MFRSTTEPAKPGAAAETPMKAFDAGFRGEWEWTQPARFRRRWELRCGGAPVATLAAPGLWRGGNGARFADASWEFRLRIAGGIVATRAGAAEPWGRYRPGWLSGGRLERADEPVLLWRRQDFWMRRWAFLTGEHLPLVRFELRPAFLRMNARVELEDAARRMHDLAPLLALGWLVVLRAHRGHSSYR